MQKFMPTSPKTIFLKTIDEDVDDDDDNKDDDDDDDEDDLFAF